MRNCNPNFEISPKEFEQLVLDWLNKTKGKLKNFSAKHREQLNANSGDYEIDILVEFEVFEGAKIVILIECKKYSRPVERDKLLILESKIRDSIANKGMIFSTSGFQKGALEYAKKYGIATICVQNGESNYYTRSLDNVNNPPPWVQLPEYIGWLIDYHENGNETHSLISNDRLESLQSLLKENCT